MIYNILHYLEKISIEKPNKIGFVDKDREFTFIGAKMAAWKIADEIFDKRYSNQPIAVLMPKSTLSLISFFGINYSGNFYVPIDFKIPKDRIEKILNDIDAKIILVDSSSLELMSSLNKNNLKMINVEKIITSETYSFKNNYNEIINNKIDSDPVYCIYTSGSTGYPKGVVISHKSLIDYIEYAVKTFEINDNVVFGNQAQFHFDISALDIYGAIKSGGTIVIIPESYFTFTANLIEYIENKAINFLYWVPTALSLVASKDSLAILNNKYIKKILFAGEEMPVKTLNYWKSYFPNAIFVNLYGPTEVTITCTHFFINRNFDIGDAIPIGIAYENSEVFILDDSDRLISSKDEDHIGELCVRGSGLALGYWRDPGKTNEKFIQNPLNSNYPDRIYRTGDLGRYNSRGEILYLGRKDNQIKHMGFRIELEEIERYVCGINGISQSFVFYDHESKEIICSYESSKYIEEVILMKNLREKLPTYMIPSKFLYYNNFPIGSSGKIDRMIISNNYFKKK
jgi:D-alanine--poly(phosphoribitol) ligase subunit 1